MQYPYNNFNLKSDQYINLAFNLYMISYVIVCILKVLKNDIFFIHCELKIRIYTTNLY